MDTLASVVNVTELWQTVAAAFVASLAVAIVARSALSTVLRRGLTGARDIGGNELFDIRTRLQQVVRFV